MYSWVKTLLFWIKFAKYFLVGMSTFLLILTSIINSSEVFRRGPQLASAQEDPTFYESDPVDYGSTGDAPVFSEPSSQSVEPETFYEADPIDYGSTNQAPVYTEPQTETATTYYEADPIDYNQVPPSAPAYTEPAQTADTFYEADPIDYGTTASNTPVFTENYNEPPASTYYEGDPFDYSNPPAVSQPTYEQPLTQPNYPQPQYEPPVYNPPVYNPPVYEPPVQQPQIAQAQPQVQQNPAPQPQVTQPQFVPTTVEDYRCEGNDKVFYTVFIGTNRAPERNGRVERNSPTCTSQFQPMSVSQPVNTSTGGGSSTSTANAQGGSVTVNMQQPSANQVQYPALSVSCLASPSSVRVGESMTWRVMTTGGSGSFKYRWSGEGVSGQTGQGVVSSYNTSGNRTVQVSVKDTVTNNEVTAMCSAQILALTATPTPTPTPTPTTVVTNPQIAQCPPGTTEKSRSGNQLVCEAQNRTNTTVVPAGIAQCPSGTIEKSRSGSQLICEAQTSVVVTSTPTPTPVQTTVVTAVQPVQCPAGTIEKSRTSAEIICERQVASAAASNTNTIVVNPASSESKEALIVSGQSANPSIKELPKTGLPFAAVGLASLTPLGLRIRRLLKNDKKAESAHDIWLQRQLS